MPFDNTETLTEFGQDTATLIRAKEILIKDGWCTKFLKNKQGQHCINGAILEALGGGDADVFAVFSGRKITFPAASLISFYRVINRVAAASDLPRDFSTAMFNNAQTSVEPVLDLLDKAIAGSCSNTTSSYALF